MKAFDDLRLTQEEIARVEALRATIPGWSGLVHWTFFRNLLRHTPTITTPLILGVYHGRDMAFLLELARSHAGRCINMTGIDKFSDTPCGDWAPHQQKMSWQTAGYGEPPDLLKASYHLRQESGDHTRIHLIKDDDCHFLDVTEQKFDFVYLDTSHDYATVSAQLSRLWRVCRPGAIVAGDDFRDSSTWGVARAVRERVKNYRLFAGWIWYAKIEDVVPPAKA